LYPLLRLHLSILSLKVCAGHSAPRSATPHPQLRKINCTLQNALAEKAAWWAAEWYAGLAPESLLKVRLRRKAGHAKERAAFRFSPAIYSASHSASATPQNQLHLAECTCRKRCMVGCDVRSGVLHASNSATASPQNQLQFINCTCRKSCVVCCDVLRGLGA